MLQLVIEMKNKIKLDAVINENRIVYLDSYNEKINDFKLANEGHKVAVTIEIADSPEYYQHKYYRGYLLPDVTFNESEVDADYVHDFILKPMFLKRKVNDHREIPKKYWGHCRVLMQWTDVVGYIPSTGKLTYREMREYIENVELYLSKIGGHLGDSGKDLSGVEKIRSIAIG